VSIDIAARLVIIDPLANHLGDANLNREQEVRRVLTPLANFARDYNVAVIVITHFNKAMSVDTAHKVGGAVAVIGVVRVAWAFVKNPENSEGFTCWWPYGPTRYKSSPAPQES
jgi:RecA-family ATPase